MALGLEGFNNGQELRIVSFVSSLNRDYLLGKMGYWMPLTKIRSI